eukprot:6251002-Amphidinium_carterae.1
MPARKDMPATNFKKWAHNVVKCYHVMLHVETVLKLVQVNQSSPPDLETAQGGGPTRSLVQQTYNANSTALRTLSKRMMQPLKCQPTLTSAWIRDALAFMQLQGSLYASPLSKTVGASSSGPRLALDNSNGTLQDT